MQLHIRHETHYAYDEPVSYSIQALKLTPRSDWGQRIVSWRVSSPGERIEQFDPYGNLTHIVTFEQPHREMRIVVEGIAEIDEKATTGAETARLSPLAYLAATPLTRPDAGVRALAERCLGRHPASRATLSDLVARASAARSPTSRASRTSPTAPPKRWNSASACARTRRTC